MLQISLLPPRVLTKKSLLSAMPWMPPPSRKMISSAKRCAIRRALSAFASSLYCLPNTCEKPAQDIDLPSRYAQIAERDHGRAGRWIAPDIQLDFTGCPGSLQRIEAFGHHLKHAGIVQVIPERFIKYCIQRGGLGIGVGTFEIRYGQPDRRAAIGARADPILGLRQRQGQQ